LRGRVLIVAGSDSGGGAGIQADIKAVTALGGYAATAITALTAQNTLGVHGVFPVDPEFIEAQMVAVLDDIGADCVKTGMLGVAPVIETVAAVLERRAAGIPLVVDPVMVAKGGARLLAPEAVDALKTRLLPRARLATPNIPEAEALLGRAIGGPGEMEAAARALLDLGPEAVLLKGGHLEGERVVDVLAEGDRIRRFEGPRIATRHTHGTGCTLASAAAQGLAQGMELAAAVARARAYVLEAIATAPGFGAGHGPLNHGHTVRPFDGT
jgi:hydroxymethylpyrimidine/phosphomethylpyrimidine kinase